MRAKQEHLSLPKDQHSFLCYEVVAPGFEFYWHYHPEYELTYIVKGRGKRLVGHHVAPFAEGDLVLLGPYLPHSWVSDKQKKGDSRAIVLQFSPSFIDPFLSLPEMKTIRQLLHKAGNGIHFNTRKRPQLTEAIKDVHSSKSVRSLTSFLHLLDLLSHQPGKPLATGNWQKNRGLTNEKRINKVLHYIHHHFRTAIRLTTAAGLIHLSQSAFCKYFRRNMGKTFSDYINDLRVAHASTLLIETDKPISRIASESGFDNLPYFNRVFLKKKQVQPGKFRRVAK